MTEVVTPRSSVPGTSLQNEPLKIDFLYFEDCPSHDRALKLLQDVLEEEGVQAHIAVRKVETEEEARQLRFPGSPTIRIDGADIDEEPALPIGLSCRVYRDQNGKMSPLPSRDKIVWAIREATRAPQIDDPPPGPA